MVNYEPLERIPLSSSCGYLKSPSKLELVHLSDSAMEVFISFKEDAALTIDADSSIDKALNEMHMTGAPSLLVRDEEDKIVGLINSVTLLGEKPIQLMEEKRIARDKVTINLLMTPIDKVVVISFDSLKHQKVGNIIATMKLHRQDNILVLENHKIVGVFLASYLTKKLHADFKKVMQPAESIAELYKRHM